MTRLREGVGEEGGEEARAEDDRLPKDERDALTMVGNGNDLSDLEVVRLKKCQPCL